MTFISAAAPRAHFKRYLTRQEEKLLLAHIAKHVGLYAQRDHAWIRLARHTGLRVGSLGALTVGLAKTAIAMRQLTVPDAIAKGGHGYDAPLNTLAERAMRDLLKLRRLMRQPDDEDAPLICSRNGNPLSERSFQHRLQVWRQSAGLQVAASPHWLRHTFAKRVIAASEHRDPQGVVQSLLGQVSRNATVIYTLPDREELQRDSEAACR